MSETAQVMAMLCEVSRKLDLLFAAQPDMTQAEFAKKANVSVKTVSRRIHDGRIVTRNGRIPASELSKFTS